MVEYGFNIIYSAENTFENRTQWFVAETHKPVT